MSLVPQPRSIRSCLLAIAGCLLIAAGLIHSPSGAHADTAGDEPPRRLVAAIPEHFLPIFEVTANRVPTGFGIEFMELVATRARLDIDYRVYSDWPSVYAALRNGEADLIPNLGISEGRSREFAFSQPFAQFTLRLFVRNEDRKRLTSPDDVLRGSGRIAVIEGNLGRQLLSRYPENRFEAFRSLPDAVVALRSGQVDALAFPAEVVWYLSRQLGIDSKIVAVGPPLAVIPRGIAVRADRADLLETFDRVIPEIMNSPDYELAMRRWFPQPATWWTWRHTLILFAGLTLAAVSAAAAMRYLGLRRANARLRQTIALNRGILDATLEAVLTVDADGIIHSANQSAEHMLRRPAADLVGASVCEVISPPDDLARCAEIGFSSFHERLTAAAANAREGIEILAHRDGESFPVRTRVAQLRHFVPPLLVLTLQDVSAQRRAEDHARYLVDHDPLTGLLNQQGALLILENLIDRAARSERPVCCIMLRLDRFAQINEQYGRSTGDALLTAAANHLSASVRQGDAISRQPESLLARAGGDRFMIILADTDADGGRIACERIMSGMRNVSVESAMGTVRCDSHAGIACHPRHGAGAAELVSHAEIALLAAREERVRRIVEFSQDLQTTHHAESRILQMLFDAIDEDRFLLHFQPVLNLADGSVRHYEALVRIASPAGGLIMPGEFIPTAERHGLIALIDYIVLHRAFSHLAGTRDGDDFSLAVNISAAHFGDRELLDWLETVFAENVVAPRQLTFEITETAALHNIAMARDFMEPLHELGCRFALDDFGVGFSSFEYLRLLPVDFVKIDGSFIRNLPNSAEDRAIARAITEVAHATGRQVIAEFVESAQHLELLTDMGVDFAQGYHIGRPAPEPPHARPGTRRT